VDIRGTHHIALLTPDLPRLQAFYTGTLGLPLVGAFHGHDIVFVGTGETAIELIQQEGAATAQDVSGWAHFALEVADVDATHAALLDQGIVFHVAPMDFPPEAPTLRIAFFRDPDGNEIELAQRLGAERYPHEQRGARSRYGGRSRGPP
jgi:glyoxylase I family protein